MAGGLPGREAPPTALGAEDENTDASVRTKARETAGEAPDLVLAGGEFGGEVKGEHRLAQGSVGGDELDCERLAEIARASASDLAECGSVGGACGENLAAKSRWTAHGSRRRAAR